MKPRQRGVGLAFFQISDSSQNVEFDFERVYQQNQNYVRRCLYWMVGPEILDDLVQETFVKVWKHKKSFRKSADLKTWIYRIAINTAIDYLRKKKIETVPIASYQDQGSESDTKRLETSQMIDRAILKLPIKHRAVFNLFYKMELSVKEVSDTLKISEGTVKSRLHKARQIFIADLKKQGVNYESK